MENNQELMTTGKPPMEAIQTVLDGKADPEKIAQLLMIQERWEANQARKAYHKAMAEFKANPPRIEKDKEVKYSNTKYNHATLGNICEKIGADLSKHGLSHSWRTKVNGTIEVTCRITHSEGHFEETTLSAPADNSGSKNAIQQIGSTITYLERYTLLALTGLATYDQDDDGQMASETHDRISKEQLSQLVDLLAEIEEKPEKLAKFMGVEKLDDILASDFQKAKNAIAARKAAKQQVKK